MSTLVFQATSGGQINVVGADTASTFNVTVPALTGTLASLASVTNNGVTYVNSSGQPTTGSALTFDGTNFLTTGSATGTAFIPSGSTVPTNGMYLPTTNSVAWSTNTTERMRLDASGNLGLGVTPSAWNSAWKAIQIGAGANFIGRTGVVNQLQIVANGYYNGTNYIYQNTGEATQYFQTGGYHAWGIAASGTAGNAITFTQAMTLDASGNLLVGTTSSSAFQNANCFLVRASIGDLIQNHVTGTASGSGYLSFGYAGGGIGSITQSGTTAVLYNVTSDQRLKENIQDAEDAATLIDSLQVRQYDWKSDGSHQRYGFVAQELVTVAPEAVHQPADPDDMMAVDYSKLVPMLVKEIQSLRKRLAAAGI